MKPRNSLTGRQQAFAQFYSLTGNGVKSAKLAGYKDGPGIRVTASSLLRHPNIALQIAMYRKYEFTDVRAEITEQIYQIVDSGLRRGGNHQQADKAIRLMERIGLFKYQNQISEDITDLEEEYGVSFQTIVNILEEIDSDPEIPEMCRALQEAKNL